MGDICHALVGNGRPRATPETNRTRRSEYGAQHRWRVARRECRSADHRDHEARCQRPGPAHLRSCAAGRYTLGEPSLLSKTEAQLLAKQIDEESWTGAGNKREPPLASPWLVANGHPALIAYCAADREHTARTARAWEVLTPAPGGRPTLNRLYPGEAITVWAAASAARLPATARRLWQLLSNLQPSDRGRMTAELCVGSPARRDDALRSGLRRRPRTYTASGTCRG